jgi:hypothetical protein
VPPVSKKFELYLMLNNITDNRYEYIKYYPMPGFNMLGGIKVEI